LFPLILSFFFFFNSQWNCTQVKVNEEAYTLGVTAYRYHARISLLPLFLMTVLTQIFVFCFHSHYHKTPALGLSQTFSSKQTGIIFPVHWLKIFSEYGFVLWNKQCVQRESVISGSVLSYFTTLTIRIFDCHLNT